MSVENPQTSTINSQLPDGYKQTDVGIIPEDWDVKYLGELTEKVGSGITPTGGEKVYKSEGRPFIRSQNVGWGNLLLDDIAFIDDEMHNTFKATEIKESDVFLNITGASIGRSVIADSRVSGGNVNQHVCIIRTIKQELYPQFLNAYLLSRNGQKQIDSFQAGGNRQGLNFGQIKSFQVPLPPLPEQQAIAEVLSDVDALITSLDQLITKKRNIKQGTMQLLLTGKKRLAGFSGDWATKKLSEIGECIIGLTYSPENVRESGLLVLRSSNIQSNRLTYDDNVFVDVQVSERIKVKEGDILICVRNGSRELIGKSALINKEAEGLTFGAFMSVFRTKYFDYVFQLFQSNIMKRQIGDNLGATINQITNKDLGSFEIPFPSVPEQNAIAQILSDMDAEIEALEKRREKYKAIKQGMMQELLTGKTRLI